MLLASNENVPGSDCKGKNWVLGLQKPGLGVMLYQSTAQLKTWHKCHWRRGLEVEGNAAGNTPPPFPAHIPTRKEEALQWARAALSSGTGVTEPEACVVGKGFLGFGLGFFGGCKELNDLTARPDGEVVPKAFLVKNDTVNHKGSSIHFLTQNSLGSNSGHTCILKLENK